MARPAKKKKICSLPAYQEFGAGEAAKDKPIVFMPVEEYETIRLMDYHGMNQQECSEQMGVARTTVQALYTAARKRIAACLVEGRPLKITGGDYEICQEDEDCLRSRHCPYRKKGCIKMKIAVTYDNGQIFQHFGKTSEFKVYTVEDSKVVSAEVIGTNGQGHGALAGILQQQAIDTLICGGIGAGAQNALAAAGITLYGGCNGSADEAVEALLAGSLDYNPAVHCNHHGHGEAGHTCGDHGCH